MLSQNNLNLFSTALTIELDQVAVDCLSCGDGKATMCRRLAGIFAFSCRRGQTNVSSAPPSCHVRVTTLGLKSLSLNVILCRDDGWTMSRSPFRFDQLFTTTMHQNVGLRVPRFEHCRSSRREKLIRGRCVSYYSRARRSRKSFVLASTIPSIWV